MGKLTPEEALRRYWDACCQCDWHLIDNDACEDGGDLTDAWEAAGLIYSRAVNKEDLDDAFAAEMGIVPDGAIWELTDTGRAALKAETQEGSHGGGEP